VSLVSIIKKPMQLHIGKRENAMVGNLRDVRVVHAAYLLFHSLAKQMGQMSLRWGAKSIKLLP
jgi:hypothetical protein